MLWVNSSFRRLWLVQIYEVLQWNVYEMHIICLIRRAKSSQKRQLDNNSIVLLSAMKPFLQLRCNAFNCVKDWNWSKNAKRHSLISHFSSNTFLTEINSKLLKLLYGFSVTAALTTSSNTNVGIDPNFSLFQLYYAPNTANRWYERLLVWFHARGMAQKISGVNRSTLVEDVPNERHLDMTEPKHLV